MFPIPEAEAVAEITEPLKALPATFTLLNVGAEVDHWAYKVKFAVCKWLELVVT